MKNKSKKTKLDKKNLLLFFEIKLNFFLKKQKANFFEICFNLKQNYKDRFAIHAKDQCFLPRNPNNVLFATNIWISKSQTLYFVHWLCSPKFIWKLHQCKFNAQPHNNSNKDYFAPFKTCATLGESAKMKIGLFL